MPDCGPPPTVHGMEMNGAPGRAAAAAVLALALSLPVVTAGPASTAPLLPDARATPLDAPPSDARAELPRPTGPHTVGRDTLHLVDADRPDPWVPSAGARQLMVSMYYPARPGTAGPRAPYMTAEEARMVLEARAPDATVPPETISGVRTWARSAAHRRAPPRGTGRYPRYRFPPVRALGGPHEGVRRRLLRSAAEGGFPAAVRRAVTLASRGLRPAALTGRRRERQPVASACPLHLTATRMCPA